MYDFDNTPIRYGTNSLKWDTAGNALPMWVADMDFKTAPEIISSIQNRASHGIYGYSIVPSVWYDAYINWWQKRHNFEIKKEWMQFCTGIVPAISCIVKRITNVGDSVLVLTPAYNIFYSSIENAGRNVLECKLDYTNNSYSINFKNLEELLSRPLTTMMILCNPHNPTGNVWSKEILCKIGKLCKKYGVIVLSDEIHCDLTLPDVNYTPFASVDSTCRENSITCISASKAFNIAGLQSACVVVPNEALRNNVVRGLNSDEVAEPNCFAIEGTVAALTKGEAWLDELKIYLAKNREFATSYLKENLPEVTLIDAKATYLLWIDCKKITNNVNDFTKFLRENALLYITSGSNYRGSSDTLVRINIACSRATLQEGLTRFKKGIQDYKTLMKTSSN